MAVTLYWMQAGACSGDSMSLLDANSPDLLETVRELDVDLLWHPSLSVAHRTEHRTLLERLESGEQRLDVLCVEGAVIRGPGGTGMYDMQHGRAKKNAISALAHKAAYVIAIGTCASHGGITSRAEVEGTGLQFHGTTRGGFLGADFVSGAGLPVINLPGCPVHPSIVTQALAALVQGAPIALDAFQAPTAWYGTTVHQGCTRNEYHEYRVEERGFGEKGCLFFHMGCQGPLVRGPCNKLLWNGRSSKTRVGVPCFGCTDPDFPKPFAFFQTRNIEGLPIDLPDGINRAHYLAYKGMAAAAAPQRLKSRESNI